MVLKMRAGTRVYFTELLYIYTGFFAMLSAAGAY